MQRLLRGDEVVALRGEELEATLLLLVFLDRQRIDRTELVEGFTQLVRLRAQRIYEHVLATMVYDKVAPGWGAGDFELATS